MTLQHLQLAELPPPASIGWATCLGASRSVPVQKELCDILARSLALWQRRAGSEAWSSGREGRQMLLPPNGSIKFLERVLCANLLTRRRLRLEREKKTQRET